MQRRQITKTGAKKYKAKKHQVLDKITELEQLIEGHESDVRVANTKTERLEDELEKIVDPRADLMKEMTQECQDLARELTYYHLPRRGQDPTQNGPRDGAIDK